MKTLRLELFQETACYKKPMAFKVGETYPLPPFSTVKGMLHALVDAKEFIPMRISIQGTYDTLFSDYQTHYFFKKTDVSEFPLVMDGSGQNMEWEHMTKMPLYMHMLYNVELLIHVEAEDEVVGNMIDSIENGKAISLGRWEDIVRINDYSIVEIMSVKSIRNKYDAYIPTAKLKARIPHSSFRLNWKYSIVKGVRKWEKIDVGYVKAGRKISGSMLSDSLGDAVFFHQ